MGITRLNYKNTSQGWWVRYHYEEGNPLFQKVFKDKDYRDNQFLSYEAAQNHLKTLEKNHPYDSSGPRQKNSRMVCKQAKKLSQPIIGVARRIHINGDYWDANVSHEKYKQIHRTFSVNKHGEREAERLAIMARILFLHAHPVKECRPFYVKF